MRKTLTSTSPEMALDRVLAGLGKELVEASDAEIEQAATDLGMNLKMKGSAAFVGVLYTYPKRIGDVFDLEALRQAREKFRSRLRSLPTHGSKDPDEK